MHTEEFQKLEGAWRGLHHLVNNTETDEMLKIRVHEHLEERPAARRSRSSRARPGTRARSSRRCTRKSTASSAASRIGAIVADYYFDNSAPDVELLTHDGEGRRGRARAVHRRRRAVGDADGIVAGTGQSARPDQDLPDAGTRRLALAAASRRIRATSAWPCRASWRASPTAPRPTRSKNSTSRKTPPAPDSKQLHLGQRGLRDGGQHQPLVQGIRLVLADPRHRVGRRGRRTCRCTPSRPTTAAST